MTSRHALSRRHHGRPQSHAPASTIAIEATARRSLAAASVAGSLMETGWPVLSSPSSSLYVPMSTDEDVRVDRGKYNLVFVCAGVGEIEATLSAGKSATRMRVACSLQPGPMRLHLSARKGVNLFIKFAALRHGTVAIAYKLASATS
jgi:hypothetical protein